MKQILIISFGYPFYGGESTTAYNLHLFLSSKNMDSKLLMLNDYYGFRDISHQKNGECIKSINQHKKSPFIKMLLFIKDYDCFRIAFMIFYVAKIIRRLLFILNIKKYLNKIKFSPDLVICNTNLLFEDIHKSFNKSILIVGTNLTLNTELANRSLAKSLIRNLNKSSVIFNSELTRSIYQSAGVSKTNTSVYYVNFAPFVDRCENEFETREYDIAFIASNFTRKIKNAKLSYALFNDFSDANKIAMGIGSDSFRDLENTKIKSLISQKEVAEVLSETKLLIITSYFDSSPGILAEAVMNGCNVLVSKNVGWHDTLNTKCVIEDYDNHDEWVSKIKYLIDNKVENKELFNIISNSKSIIYNLINGLANR